MNDQKIDIIDNTENIKNEYIYGIIKNNERVFPSIKDLSKKYNINHNELQSLALSQQWDNEKNQTWQEIKNITLEKRKDDIIQKSIEFDEKCGQSAIEGLNLIKNELEILSDQQKTGEKINHNKIRALAQSLEMFQKVGRLIYGEATENHSFKNEIVFIQQNNDGRSININENKKDKS